MNRRCLMIQGTTSDAGKSTLTAALCRVLKRRNVRVAPFKPQNMALNSAVATDGGEIGRAQALQAQAAGVATSSDMNPVLLKPNSDSGAQIIINGRGIGNMDAVEYHDYKRVARDAVMAAYRRLSSRYDVLLVEGAGSPAEINLRRGDIANMGFAEAVDCPVLLIADIDRGGVFAHIVGTIALLSDSERARIVGFVINRFRGDRSLLDPGLCWLEQHTGKPVFGVLPYLQGLALDAEDAIRAEQQTVSASALRVQVPVLPRISNHTDFDALRAHPQVDLRFVGPGERPDGADVVILPGSKSVRADLAWLRAHGWEEHLRRHLRYGGRLIGICGGFQMLGRSISDPEGVESVAGTGPGLGWLDFETVLQTQKQLRNVQGTLQLEQASISGYEIHAGISLGPALQHPAVMLNDGRRDGALSDDAQILGTYLHGLFDDPSACRALLRWMGLTEPEPLDQARLRETAIDRIADAVEAQINLGRLFGLLDLHASRN